MKKRAFLISEFSIDLIASLTIIILGFVMHFSYDFYNISLWILMGLALVNVILIAVSEYLIKEYQSKKFSIIIHVSYAVLNCGLYSLVKYIGNFDYLGWLYMLISYLGTIIIALVFIILNYKIKDKKQKGPKVYVNKNRQ